MKLPISIRLLSIFVLVCTFAFAQQDTSFAKRSNAMSLEDVIQASSVIVEGKVIDVGCIETASNIYSSAIIRISKVFKGAVTDTTIEVVYAGGMCNGNYQLLSHGMSLTTENDGVFLLTTNASGIQVNKGLKSYMPVSYIAYHHGAAMVAHHMATCKGVVYDDLEIDLFKRIEAATHVSRKVVALNEFEKAAASKK